MGRQHNGMKRQTRFLQNKLERKKKKKNTSHNGEQKDKEIDNKREKLRNLQASAFNRRKMCFGFKK